MNSWRTHSGSLSLSAALMMAASSAAVGQETRNAFVWIELTPPTSGDFENWQVVQSVKDINNQGRIIGQVSQGGSSTRGFIITNGQWTMLKPNDVATIVREINGESNVVGWTSTATGRGWSPEYTQNGAELGSGIRVEGINDSNHYVGYDVNQSTPVGWLTAAEGWVALPPLNEGDATAAHGISHGDQSNYPLIVGRSIDDEQAATFPVAWTYDGQDFTAHALDPGLADETDLPFTVNNSGWIVGATNASSPYGYLLWVPDGEDSWARVDLELSGATQSGIDLNASNEIVAKDTLFVLDDQAALTALELYDLVNLPTSSSEATRWYDTTATTFLAINDHGWIAGKARRKESGQSDVDVVLLLVPYDLNNNGEPDYREIMADPELDEDEDWVLDSTTKMRVGLYAINVGSGTDNLVQDVGNITAVRLHGNYELINRILTNPPEDPNACQNFRALLSYLGGHQSQGHQGKEIILMIRTPWPTNENLDYIPDAQTQEAMLADLRCFVSKYAHDIDYVQFGNEIFGGPGEYYVDLGGGCTGTLGSLTDSACYIAACEAVFAWMQKQADAVREASALAGRPLQMITPAVFYGQVNTGYETGSIEPPLDSAADRNAYAIQSTVLFGNRNGAAVDIHLHYRDAEQRAEMYSGVDRLLEGNSGQQQNIWDPPFAITALEWSPVPKTDWLLENQGPLSTYFQSNPNLVETTWEQFFDGWARATFTEPERTMEDLIDEDLAAFNGLLRHACYGEYGQPQSGSLDQWDTTVVRANRVHSADLPWMLETNYERLTNVAKGLAASGASYLPTDPFNPHPNTPFDGDCGCD